MGENSVMSREERLAAKLRENLRRRKVQSRALDAAAETQPGQEDETESGAPLSKQPPSR